MTTGLLPAKGVRRFARSARGGLRQGLSEVELEVEAQAARSRTFSDAPRRPPGVRMEGNRAVGGRRGRHGACSGIDQL